MHALGPQLNWDSIDMCRLDFYITRTLNITSLDDKDYWILLIMIIYKFSTLEKHKLIFINSDLSACTLPRCVNFRLLVPFSIIHKFSMHSLFPIDHYSAGHLFMKNIFIFIWVVLIRIKKSQNSLAFLRNSLFSVFRNFVCPLE